MDGTNLWKARPLAGVAAVTTLFCLAPTAATFANRAQAGGSASSDSQIGYIVITGSDQSNDITLSYTGASTYRVTDSGGIEAINQCAQVDATTADCLNTAPAPTITFAGAGGNDRAVFDVPFPSTITVQTDLPPSHPEASDHFEITAGSPARARFSAYSGRDVLIGAAGDDFLSGGRGADRLLGHSGDDRLLGAHRADTLIAGPGDDRVEAAHDDRDAQIRCGAGTDLAVVDMDLDPEPKGCETIRVR